MFTWKLWRALQTPPADHPLFYFVCHTKPLRLQGFITRLAPAGLTALLVAFAIGIWYAPRLIMPVLFNPTFAAITGLLLFTGTIYGLVWATSISEIIIRLRGEGKYDLLVLSPATPLRINWAICTGFLYRNQSFRRISQQRARITQVLIMLITILAIPLLLGFVADNDRYMTEVFSTLISIIALTTLLHLDHIQSAVIGTLIGLNVPLLTHRSADSRLLAGGTFLIFQIASYLALWVLGFVLLPDLHDHLHIPLAVQQVSLPISRVLVFFFSREIIILCLWHGLTNLLHERPTEIDLLASYPTGGASVLDLAAARPPRDRQV
ncbi:MAG: hypothetical protein K8J31_00950 [Anaerolineae bacterium]|nr:hypothetical protein [Anaerolineae bacterium]